MAYTDCKTATALENLSRLANKPGVQATLVLSRRNGSVIEASGSLTTTANEDENGADGRVDGPGSNNELMGAAESIKDGFSERPPTAMEKLAKSVFTFVSAAEELARSMGREDDVRLLRMRTKNNELVIVPGIPILYPYLHNMYTALQLTYRSKFHPHDCVRGSATLGYAQPLRQRQ